MAVVIASSVRETGEREVIGLYVGLSEEGAFWLQFLRSLMARGLTGVQLVSSDAHEDLKQAIAAVLHQASWQRYRVHWLRNALALVPKSTQQMVAATIRAVFMQPDAATAHEHWRKIAGTFHERYPRLAELMEASEESEEEVLAYIAPLPTIGGRSGVPISWSCERCQEVGSWPKSVLSQVVSYSNLRRNKSRLAHP